MNKFKKYAVILSAIIILSAAAAVVYFRFLPHDADVTKETDATVERFFEEAPSSTQSEDDETQPDTTETDAETLTEPAVTDETTADEPEKQAAYESPVDFKKLTKENSDIYGWLYIPGTDITYPLLRREGDDAYYLKHDAEGNYNINGALFTETAYNGAGFDDPVTVVYGHQMKSGLMFGRLQEYYSDPETFEKYNEIIIYLPERELHFEIFAAVSYDNRHILYNYDFTDRRIFRLFFDSILSVRSLSSHVADDAEVIPSDQVLILSTCLIGDSASRYLVCSKLISTKP